jgi:hypothetical protein
MAIYPLSPHLDFARSLLHDSPKSRKTALVDKKTEALIAIGSVSFVVAVGLICFFVMLLT